MASHVRLYKTPRIDKSFVIIETRKGSKRLLFHLQEQEGKYRFDYDVLVLLHFNFQIKWSTLSVQ